MTIYLYTHSNGELCATMSPTLAESYAEIHGGKLYRLDADEYNLELIEDFSLVTK